MLKTSFQYPYPLSWKETDIEEWKSADFSLIEVSLGKRTVPSFIYSSSYKPDEKIYALTLYFKIKTYGSGDVGVCYSPNFRLVLSEEGDLMSPINNRFNAECLKRDRTYLDQEVIFVVPETEKEFYITTGGRSNIFFTVTVSENGDLEVEKVYNEEKG